MLLLEYIFPQTLTRGFTGNKTMETDYELQLHLIYIDKLM